MNSNNNAASRITMAGPRVLTAALLLFLIMGCAVLLAGPVRAEERPFKGRDDGQFVATPTAVPWIVISQDAGTGNVTHIGACKMVGIDMIDLSAMWMVGAFTWTATNGDLLMGEYSGPMAFGNSPGSISWLLTATIVGGTGRFQHATGEFVFVGEGEIVITNGVGNGRFTETFDGTINY